MERADNRLFIVDTTLRDGEQRAGLAFGTAEKVRCAMVMDKIGIDQIEAGIPAMCAEEREAIRIILAKRRRALISTWNRMNEADIRVSLALRPDIVHIGVPVSDLMIDTKLQKSRAHVIETMKRCVSLAQTESAEVTLGFEDASRADPLFMAEAALAAQRLGVRRIRYADTVGIAHPSKIARDVAFLIAETGLSIECHAHDDLGMAVANSLEAAKAGARYIDTTFFGIGERAGNCDFSRFIRAAGGRFGFGFHTDNAGLLSAERNILAILNFNPSKRA